MAKKLRIFAFGGNEVAPVGVTDPKTGKPVVADIPMQWRRTADTCRLVADIIQAHPEDLFILTHGNGPQVGNILLRAEYSRPILPPLPLDVCGADTQGAMGFMMAQLENELRTRGIEKQVNTVVTRVLVDDKDPDFKDPSKYIGPSMTKEEAEARRKEGLAVKLYKKDDKGREIWRRVVPSPSPIDILEIGAVELFLKAGIIPVTVGGGGVPVMLAQPVKEGGKEFYETNYGIRFERRTGGKEPVRVYAGLEAVIDKDLASALLGTMLLKRAKERGEELEVTLTIFTGEDGAKLNYQKPDQVDLRKLTLKEAQEIFNRKPCPFPAGSMGPKINAAIKFVEGGGNAALITKTDLFEATLAGKAGTTIVPC
ncbi:MAG TPA: carbamate kinase [Elusimicrobia bacterium]|nr:carbamate kinase [Elusimicrobiota bacterium]